MHDSAASESTPARPRPSSVPEPGPGFLGPWSERAICPGEDPDLFFPSRGDPGTRAKQICANCPVRLDCLKYAIEADEFGIWGGLDQQERRNLLRKRKKRESSATKRIRSLRLACTNFKSRPEKSPSNPPANVN